jgi:steroid 5-alpha reductase family enzyme
MAETLLSSAAAIAVLMIGTWLVSLPVRNASIVDLIWGFGFVVVAWTTALGLDEGGLEGRSLVLTVLTTIWGLRLSGYLAWRNIGKGEDFRYVAMRKKHGSAFPLVSLATVFLLQGVLMWVVSLPVQAGQHSSAPFGVLAWLGMASWAVGLVFETVGDAQLARFKADPDNKGKVMTGGLWRYTRHPNYFGDFMVWWGLFLIAIDGGLADTWWSVIGPAIMTALLMKYSGAGLLESTITNRRPGYAEYISRTNGFFPGPPKS